MCRSVLVIPRAWLSNKGKALAKVTSYLLKSFGGDQDKLRRARIKYIKKRKVMPSESEADEFAVKQIGKETFIRFLQFCAKSRPKGKPGGLNHLGQKELKLRIKLIKKLKLPQ